MEGARNPPELGMTNHQDFPDLMNRAARVGLNKL
jgi:hypothetical protein